jgi:hypothetical protein
MPVAPRQIQSTVFEQRMVVNGGMVTAVPQPQPQQPAPQTPVRKKHAVRPKHVPQTAQMAAMTFMAVVIVALGMLYLSCCAHVTHEQYRRAKLQGKLRSEREIAERLGQEQSVLTMAETVEKAAALNNMVAGDERTAVALNK